MAYPVHKKSISLGFVGLIIALICLVGCKEAQQPQAEVVDPATLPQGDLADSSFLTVYDLYSTEGVIDTVAVLKAFKAAFSDLPSWDTIPKDFGGGGIIHTYIPDAQKDFPPGDAEFLAYAGSRLDVAEKEALMKAKDCISLGVIGTAKDRWTLNRRFCAFVAEYMEGKPLLIFDEACREYDNRATWIERKLDLWKGEMPILPLHFVQHAYREEDGYCRMVSLGMEKFGLPNIVINHASCSSQGSLSSLINLMAQTLAENSILEKPGELVLDIEALRDTTARNMLLADLKDKAQRKGLAHIRFGKPEEGDSPGPLIELYTYDPQYSIQQQYQDALVSRIFGASDVVVHTDPDDGELQAASDRARAALPRIKEKFNKGLGLEEYLMVKLPFKTDDGGKEYMWVEVIEWEGDEVKGLLNNDPDFIADLKAGSTVTGSADDIFDYILQGPNGSEGNGTGKVIERMQQGR